MLSRVIGKIQSLLWNVSPSESKTNFLKNAFQSDPARFIDALAPFFNRTPDLDSMNLDFSELDANSFESFSGLFTSNTFNHGVISMTFRDAAYLYGIVKRLQPKRLMEIGRYKGGSTVLISSAMPMDAEFWSLDIGEKEGRLSSAKRKYDDQARDFLKKIGKKTHLIVGDSRLVDLPAQEFDLVFIDGDHSYEGAKNDLDRFGRKVRPGGLVLLDDAFGKFLTPRHEEVYRLVQEVTAPGGGFTLMKQLDRLACLKRI